MGLEHSWGGEDGKEKTKLDPDATANPCGLIAKSVFTDRYELFNSKGDKIPIEENGIAWSNDIGTKFKRTGNSATHAWVDVENEHFIVWMRTSGLPDFHKLWGKIDEDLEGTYKIKINNSYNVAEFDGNKSIYFSTAGPLGGKNIFLSLSFIIVGICFFVISAVF